MNFKTNPSLLPKLLQRLLLCDLTAFDCPSLPFDSKPHLPLVMAWRMLQSPFPWQKQNLENKEWKFFSPSSWYWVGQWAAPFLPLEVTLTAVQSQWGNGGLFLLLKGKSCIGGDFPCREAPVETVCSPWMASGNFFFFLLPCIFLVTVMASTFFLLWGCCCSLSLRGLSWIWAGLGACLW